MKLSTYSTWLIRFSCWFYHNVHNFQNLFENYSFTFHLSPDIPMLAYSNSAAKKKDMMSKIWTNGDTVRCARHCCHNESSVYVLACVRACVRPFSPGPLLLQLWKDFKIIWHNCSPSRVDVLFEIFVQVGPRSRSHFKVKFLSGL